MSGDVYRVALFVTMPHRSERASIVQERFYVGEELRVDAQRRLVLCEERVAQGDVLRVLRQHAEASAQEAPRAVRRRMTQCVERDGVESLRPPNAVQRGAEIRRRVGQRSVEVEEHRVDGKGARRAPRDARRVSRHGETPSCN